MISTGRASSECSFNRKRSSVLIHAAVALLIITGPLHAEEPTPFRLGSHEQIPRWISDAAVSTNVGLDLWQSLYKTDSRTRWAVPCRYALTFGLVELGKWAIHRERPNGYDDNSTPSGHTAFASTAAHSPMAAGFTVVVGWGRQAGGMHYATDVALGALTGLVARKVCQ